VAVAQLITKKTTVREDLGLTSSNGTFRGWLLWITTSPFCILVGKEKEVALIKRVKLTREFEEMIEVAFYKKLVPVDQKSLS